ncbi:MAG: GntG family PLP-dependent aldolase, partial [Candidatus Bathyarchaeia archaeon]
CPPTTLVCMENTHNHSGGSVLKPDDMRAIYDLAKSEKLAVHTDGARIFNAAVALNIDVKKLARYSDSVMFCLSKGLSAPVGSIVVGDYDFIEKARKVRKMLGGGMRQAGVIAAPGIIALEKMIDRLKDDHLNAKLLAEGISKIRGIEIDLAQVQTNILMFKVDGLGITAKEFAERLEKKGIKVMSFGSNVRMVTHRGVGRDDIRYVVDIIKEMFPLA